jgi:betaine reductase
MAKAIEELGIPAVHVCTIVPISETVGANRILPGVAIPNPTGNPNLSQHDEFMLRKNLMLKALDSLKSAIEEQTVF